MQARRHFTIIELLVVIMVIIILCGITIAGMRFASRRSDEVNIIARMKKMQLALEAYRRDWGYYPIQTVANGTLNFPVTSPSGTAYAEGITTVPFQQNKDGTAVRYRYPGTSNPQSYELWAAGVDETFNTADDIKSWAAE